ncbi:hypothetical protein [Jiella pacifica]|uniref:Uncharacterized protein n=1 Tax=Jiella pacifica TaxID=2696469 RepID=A0A6N9SYC4_9HYPH|nr:hypothetical protein [Jiella pacifica]NDW04084.1 hypothetical protein [Jiella pacifica]
MILIIYDDAGRLIQSIHEPIPKGYSEQLTERGTPHLLLGEAGEPTPDVHAMYRSKWVEDGELRNRPYLPASLDRQTIAADGQDEARLTGLPVPCDVTITGPDGRSILTVEDGELALTADVAATYAIAIDHWPHLPWRAEVIAT